MSLMIQAPAIGILGVIGCFVAIGNLLLSARPPCPKSLPNHGTFIVFSG